MLHEFSVPEAAGRALNEALQQGSQGQAPRRAQNTPEQSTSLSLGPSSCILGTF